ncbi:MAG TPA: protein translocase subunit SecD [Chloroflexi bacterium]|nr:protein translocase subunit SecD [Chloroflexota bacterium]
MKQSESWRFAIIILIALVALYVSLDIEHPQWVKNLAFWQPAAHRDIALRLGLDLQGGLKVLLAAQAPEGEEIDPGSIQEVRRIIESRVNALGLTEPVVQSQGERRIIVELPGIENPELAVETIKDTALLEFVDVGRMWLEPGAVITTTEGPPTFGVSGVEETALILSEEDAMPTTVLPTPTEPTAVEETVEERDLPPMPEDPAERADMYSAPPEMQIDVGQTYTATISTAKGDIVVQLDPQAAPLTVNNFVFLSQQGFYDGLTFHRVEPGFVIQGGDPLGTGGGGPGYTVPAEIGLPHTKGAIATARLGDQMNPERASSGSQFYIALEALPQLDNAYTVFGQVVEGMDVVESIEIGDVIQNVSIVDEDGEAPVPADTVTDPTVETPPSPATTPQTNGEAIVYETILTGDQLTGVDLNVSPQNEFIVSIAWNDEAAEIFYEYTAAHVGQHLCILLDKTVISCPRINQPIPGGQASITGNFTLEEARRLALQLRYGALPVPMHVESFNRIGATLGSESVERSIRAGLVGLSIVLFFMLVYYRIPGVLANFALIIYVLINIAVYKLAPITLTLPGIAGFILSAGMAVDANILIFERLKEELRRGRRLMTAIEIGFDRAWPSIRDGQLSNLIICGILFFFGSNFGASIVKGFAITLAIGTVINIFTAVFATRTFVRQFAALAGDWLAEHERLLGV